MATYAELIRTYRISKKLTQVELAEKIGASQRQITRYENEVSVPSANTWKQIKKVLDIEEDPIDMPAPQKRTMTAETA